MVSRQWATAMTTRLADEAFEDAPARKFSRRLGAHRAKTSRHNSRLLPFRPWRRRRRRQSVARAGRQACLARPFRGNVDRAKRGGRSRAATARGARRAKALAASCARSAACLPDGCGQTSLRELVRVDGLLRLFGGAGRAFRSRCAWRERIHLARIGRAVHGASDYQSSARLRRRLSQPRSRLCSARCACRARPSAGRARRRKSLTGSCARFCKAWPGGPRRWSSWAAAFRPRSAISVYAWRPP